MIEEVDTSLFKMEIQPPPIVDVKGGEDAQSVLYDRSSICYLDRLSLYCYFTLGFEREDVIEFLGHRRGDGDPAAVINQNTVLDGC